MKNTNDGNRVVFLRGNMVNLRPLEESDLERCTRWINDPEVSRYLSGLWPLTMQAERKWLESHSTGSKSDVVLAIETKDGVHIGNIGFHNIKWTDGVAVSGAMIGDKRYWDKGYGTDAKMQLVNWAFSNLGLRKLCSQVIAFNARSLAYSKKCGYKVEGVLAKHVLRDGGYPDVVNLALFKEDWPPIWKAYLAKGKKRRKAK
ncbi:MAG: GNAT family protein [Candidatus Paceibacterota bacterium]